jgi:hypothetical protein
VVSELLCLAEFVDVGIETDDAFGTAAENLGCSVRAGDESVKSSSSTSSREERSSCGAGIGATLMAGPTVRSFVGVAEARQVSRVVCLVLLGDGTSEGSRGSFAFWAVVVRVLAFFAGNCEGEGSTGELSRSSVSTVASSLH